MQGFLYIDKPTDWTSFDVVAYVRRMVTLLTRQRHLDQGYCMDVNVPHDPEKAKPCKCKAKVGHTGTLDPAATGLLTICVGKAFTKQVPGLIKQDKTYEVELTLGTTSTTGDREGELTKVTDKQPLEDDVRDVIKTFVGKIQQIPPAFSAIKIDGKRAYDLARAGKEVKMQPRSVHIHFIDNITFNYPIVTFTTRVGSGTYIRSLAEDIGTELGTGAYMSALRRTSIGDKTVAQAYPVSTLTDKILIKTLDPTG